MYDITREKKKYFKIRASHFGYQYKLRGININYISENEGVACYKCVLDETLRLLDRRKKVGQDSPVDLALSCLW